MKGILWTKYGFEFLSIFIAVVAAFALENWRDNQRDTLAADKILVEIYNGLEKDLEDVHINIIGHEAGLNACTFWRKAISGQDVVSDSSAFHYLNLTRDFINVQNSSGYETLKSRGLELITNDSLRTQIISLYEYDYSALRKLEEEYDEVAFQKSYFDQFNKYIAPHFQFDEQGGIRGIRQPLTISEQDRNLLLSYLWKIEVNRQFMLRLYRATEEKINALRQSIQKELNH